MTIKPMDLEQFSSIANSVHEAIVVTSKRARQINEEIKIEFNQRVEMFTTRTEIESEETDINPDQLKVSLEFEKRPKPTEIALDELFRGETEWRYKEREEIAPVVTADDEEDEE
ncbi:MAG: DNA-directed RNA polymerase subunit omega [Ignavibacteria bacterium]|nr:DNA-directed RNA polymerase subunit omega [Ignavibacteria bacterium]